MRYEIIALLQSMNSRVTRNIYDPDDTVPVCFSFYFLG